MNIICQIYAFPDDCNKFDSSPLSVIRIDFLRAETLAYAVEGNAGEHASVAVRCEELAHQLRLEPDSPETPSARALATVSTTLWIRLCPQVGAIGLRIGGLDSPLAGACRARLRLTAQLHGVAAAPLDRDRSTLWGVTGPQLPYSRCTLAEAAVERKCFGELDTLYGPMVIEAFPGSKGDLEADTTDGGGYRVISLSSAQGWRSPGLRLTPLRGAALPPTAINLEASVDFADSDAPSPSRPPPPPPFPALAARGVVTSPFIVVAAARSFAALRNGAEALNRAYNSVCTLAPPAAAADRSFATAASLHLPHEVPVRDLAGGKVLRVMRYRDEEEAARCALEANRTGFRYILIDAGWYGPELNHHSNPLAPEALGYATRICAAAARHGLGVFLYINRRHLEQHMPGLAGALRAAGAAGVKFGFVNYSTTRDVEAVVGWAHACLREGLLVNTHDDLLPSGLQLLMPNMLSFEAVLGNEAFPPAIHSVRVGLLRGLAGSADYTPVMHNPRRHLPLVHVLGLPVLLFNPLQHLYFYSVSFQVAAAPNYFRRVWAAVPTTWARTVWLSGHPDTHAAVARRAAGDGSWYLCVVCAAVGCGIDLRGNVQALVGCGRPVTVETFLDAGGEGNRSVVAVPAARVADVCDEGQGREQLGRAELAEGQAVLVWVRRIEDALVA